MMLTMILDTIWHLALNNKKTKLIITATIHLQNMHMDYKDRHHGGVITQLIFSKFSQKKNTPTAG